MDEEKDIPQIVGISKKQLFMFMFFLMMLGISSFCIGYYLAVMRHKEYFYIDKSGDFGSSANRSQNNGKMNGIVSGAINGVANVGSSLPGVGNMIQGLNQVAGQICGYYVLIGRFTNEEQSLKMIADLKRYGKNPTMKFINGGYMVYIGPYQTESLANTEVEALNLLPNSINASIVSSLY